MPVLDVEQLKKSRGMRVHLILNEQMPPLPGLKEVVEPVREAEYDLTLTNAGGTITVEGVIRLELKVNCNRCLESFVCSLEAGFQEVYFDRDAPLPGSKGTEWIPFSGDTIDITPEAAQSILVGLPMRFLCSDNCLGLCPVCGTNLNKNQCTCEQIDIDPRLAKLKELIK